MRSMRNTLLVAKMARAVGCPKQYKEDHTSSTWSSFSGSTFTTQRAFAAAAAAEGSDEFRVGENAHPLARSAPATGRPLCVL